MHCYVDIYIIVTVNCYYCNVVIICESPNNSHLDMQIEKQYIIIPVILLSLLIVVIFVVVFVVIFIIAVTVVVIIVFIIAIVAVIHLT